MLGWGRRLNGCWDHRSGAGLLSGSSRGSGGRDDWNHDGSRGLEVVRAVCHGWVAAGDDNILGAEDSLLGRRWCSGSS